MAMTGGVFRYTMNVDYVSSLPGDPHGLFYRGPAGRGEGMQPAPAFWGSMKSANGGFLEWERSVIFLFDT